MFKGADLKHRIYFINLFPFCNPNSLHQKAFGFCRATVSGFTPLRDAFPSLTWLSCPWVLTDMTEHATNWALSLWVCDMWGVVQSQILLHCLSCNSFFCFSCVLPALLCFFPSKEEIREKYLRMVLKNPWNLRADPRAVGRGNPTTRFHSSEICCSWSQEALAKTV